MWRRKKTPKADLVYCASCGLWLAFVPGSVARCHYCQPLERLMRID
jgi:hypothetical protein